MRVCNGMIYVP